MGDYEEQNDTEDSNEETVLDFSTLGLEDSDEDNSEEQPEVDNEVESDNEYPSTWNPILEKLPKEFHNLVAPELRKWDQGVNDRFQKIHQEYEPYKYFKENSISPETLYNAYAVAQQLEANPPGFLEDLKQALKAQGYEAEAEVVQQKIDEEEDEDLDPRDIQLQQLMQRQQAMEQALLSAQQEAMEQQIQAQAMQEVDDEFDQLEAKMGGRLSPDLKLEVARRTAFLSEQLNRPVSVEEGYQDLNRLIANSRRVSPGARAPRITPGGGGLPANNQQAYDLDTSEGRSAKALAIIQAMQGN